MVQLVTPRAVDAAGPDLLRNAHAALLPIIRELPATENYLFSDASTREALKCVAELDSSLFTTYMDVIRGRCGRTVARMVAELAGASLPSGNHHPLTDLTAPDLVAHALPVLQPILEPWLSEKTLCMVHAKRGVGKTLFALSAAFAVATGGEFLTYRALAAREVLYIDGEMQAQLMQTRVRERQHATGQSGALLRVVTPDLQEASMPDLGTVAGQRCIDALVRDETAVIVIDNLSCLVRSGGAENDSVSWDCVAPWLLSHRRAGRAVLVVHHSGKGGAQRGTSKREDLLDVVINLRRPVDYNEADGAVFVVEFEKARSLRGESLEPFEARLETLPDGRQLWSHRSVEAVTKKNAIDLWDGGALTLMDITRELGVNKSTAHRQLQTAMQSGLLTRPYPAAKKGRN